jgi:hypothetical protein
MLGYFANGSTNVDMDGLCKREIFFLYGGYCGITTEGLARWIWIQYDTHETARLGQA